MCSHDSTSSGRKLEDLEREICQLASHIHAATCRWLRLLSEFDRREGWAPWGCRSCAHWVSWRCGIAPEAAREHVRVARRLDELPLITAAFGEGRLSYSKVRALTRVGEVAAEEELLELARHATAAQLERLVRAFRGVRAVEAQARGKPDRWVSWSYGDDGALHLRARLPGEEGAMVVAAIEAAVEAARAEAATARVANVFAGDEGIPAGGVSAETDLAHEEPARGVSAETHLTDEEPASGVPAETHLTHEEPARGVSAGTELAHEEPARGVSAETDLAAEEPRRNLGEERADALLCLAEAGLAAAAAAGQRTGGDRYQVVVHVDQEALCGNAAERGGHELRCELDAGVPLAAETARRLACDAALVPLLARGGRSPDVGRKRRTIPPALRRALSARDRGCRFPGCGARRFVDAHHVVHWADGGVTAMDNLVQLCRHHHRLLHEGGYTISGHPADGGLVFRRPDGRRVRACPRLPRGRPNGVRPRGDTVVEPTACVSLSAGERLDVDLGVSALLAWTRPEDALGAAEPIGA